MQRREGQGPSAEDLFPEEGLIRQLLRSEGRTAPKRIRISIRRQSHHTSWPDKDPANRGITAQAT